MTLEELTTAVKARGFDYLADSQVQQFINDAVTEVDAAADWPYLEQTMTGNPPLTISDLATITSVVNTGPETKLSPIDPRVLTDLSPDTSQTGTPIVYWLDNSSGSAVLRVFPVDTGASLSVSYRRFSPSLSFSIDTPLLPPRFHSVLVQLAVARCYDDSSDYDGAANARNAADRILNTMLATLLHPQHDRPSSISVIAGSADGTYCG